MEAPTRPADPVGDKRRALKHAAVTAHRADRADEARRGAILLASEAGNSLRDIAKATGIPFVTVKRIIDKQRASV